MAVAKEGAGAPGVDGGGSRVTELPPDVAAPADGDAAPGGNRASRSSASTELHVGSSLTTAGRQALASSEQGVVKAFSRETELPPPAIGVWAQEGGSTEFLRWRSCKKRRRTHAQPDTWSVWLDQIVHKRLRALWASSRDWNAKAELRPPMLVLERGPGRKKVKSVGQGTPRDIASCMKSSRLNASGRLQTSSLYPHD